MDWLTDPQIWASLLTLTALEIVLGVDNLVFIAILAGRLPAERRDRECETGNDQRRCQQARIDAEEPGELRRMFARPVVNCVRREVAENGRIE